MKKLLYIFVALLLFSACVLNGKTDKLDQIDSLIYRNQYDSAYMQLKEFENMPLSEEENAHYCLLLTQLGYLVDKPQPSDSLLDIAATYYKKVKNGEKLAEVYHYKSYRLRKSREYPQAIIYGRKAEQLSKVSHNNHLKFKIVENLACLNGLCENNLFQLRYAKKALALALEVGNKNWLAYSYNRISFAFASYGELDSAFLYVEKTRPYIEYVKETDKAIFLTNIGSLYKLTDNKKAKYYLEKALLYDNLPLTYEHLADIYYDEGAKERAYDLWKKALTISRNYQRDNLLHNIIAYDIEHGSLDDVCKNVDEIILIKDSIITKVKNDTIKDLQLRFEHEIAMHEADKKLITTQRVAMGLALLLILMAFYIYFRKRREEMVQKDLQMQLYAYTTEINQLKEAKENSIAQIKDFESDKDKYSRKIIELEENVKNADIAIKDLNKSIRKLLNNEAPKLKLGRELYDSIMSGGTAVEWHSKEEDLFNNYYSCVNYSGYINLKKVKRKSNLSPHNLFYLILKDMGKSDDEIRRIMALSPEGLRSLRNRTKPI